MSNELVFVDGDPLRMEQIVWNLLNNAVKFTPAGGTVTVKLGKRNGFARLAVADTGQGIEPKFLPHVFEIFRQADATISRRHGGMGIGLALVQQLVQLQGGSVSVSSGGTGHGAEFTINLPLTTEATEPRKTGSLVQPNALTGMRILVVDDSSDTVDMLRTLLKMDGAMVTTAGSGPEALEILAREVFDVILSDISMPDMDGFELLNRMRKLPNGRDVPVLALTGFGRLEDVERATAEGFFSHITKPVDVGQIVAMLQKLPARA
jgi:two-component system CheB/CheR fusion protein